MTKKAIGIDLGGSSLSLGLVTEDGRIESLRREQLLQKNVSSIVDLIARNVKTLLLETDAKIEGIGAGIPGIVDPEQGIVFQSPHFPLWKDVPIEQLLSEKISYPVIIQNDAKMFARGEQKFGSGKGHRNFIMLTLGSGIGCGLVLEEHVFQGDYGFAGEAGHMVIEPNGPVCNCGNHGCWELFAASHAFLHLTKRISEEKQKRLKDILQGKEMSPENMFLLAQKGDAVAKELWGFFGIALGIGITSLINILGVTTVVIAGGISQAWDFFIDATKKEIISRSYAKNSERLLLLPGQLGTDGGVIGAASVFFESHKS